MGKQKTWAKLTRRQRREVRAYMREELVFWDNEARIDGHSRGVARWFPQALRAALVELKEPKR